MNVINGDDMITGIIQVLTEIKNTNEVTNEQVLAGPGELVHKEPRKH